MSQQLKVLQDPSHTQIFLVGKVDNDLYGVFGIAGSLIYLGLLFQIPP